MTKVMVSQDEENWFPEEIKEWARMNSYFFSKKFFPPYEIACDHARRGIINHGMSAYLLWKPFTLESHEYEEIYKDFLELHKNKIAKKNGKHLIRIPAPGGISTVVEWQAWNDMDSYGIPYERNLHLLLSIEKNREKYENSIGTKDEETNLMALERSEREHNSLIDEYIKPS